MYNNNLNHSPKEVENKKELRLFFVLLVLKKTFVARASQRLEKAF